MKSLLLTLFLSSYFLSLAGQTPGCTDPLAQNYNPEATINDGSCQYGSALVSPLKSWVLPSTMDETSGLILWNDKIWTHNDDHDINLYSFDTTDVNAYTAWPLTGTVNIDWEEITQDENYIYLGDIGNNNNGNRTNLQILRIEKNSLLAGEPSIDTISYSYALQTDFSPTGGNNTDFDCEAFIVSGDSIFLFTKEWVSQRTSLYAMPKVPGEHVAAFRGSYNVQGLITGSAWLEEKRLIVLTGYSTLLQPFLVLLYDFQNTDFFSGNIRKIDLDLSFHQVEAIATQDGLKYFISNEFFSYLFVTVPQKLHLIDLTDYLETYLDGDEGTTHINTSTGDDDILVFPNPVSGHQSIQILSGLNLTGQSFRLINLSGQQLKAGKIDEKDNHISLAGISPGIYFLVFPDLAIAAKKVIIGN